MKVEAQVRSSSGIALARRMRRASRSADGHHRYAISRTYRDERRAAANGAPGLWDLTLTYVNELIAEQLSVAAIQRRRYAP